jgi:hypothetical protein
MSLAIKNRELIDGKKAKLSETIRQVKAKVKVIETEAQDKYFNDLIVISNNTISEMEKLRKQYTSQVNDWLKHEIAPENELKLEVGELVGMRNARAKKLKDAADLENKKIQAEKDKKLYEAEVKGAMKLSFEKGLIERLVAFEKSIDDYFVKNLTIENAAKMEAAFKGMKPKLTEEFFLGLFHVDFDIKRMSQDEYDALVKRAKGYWIYEDINAKYVTEATAIVQKWIEKIPQRVKELQVIAAGGAQAERVKKIVEEREANERAETKRAAEAQVNQVARKVNEEVQGDQMSAEFKAQAQEQSIEQPGGTRNTKFFVLDNPGDTLQISKVIGSIIVHTIPSKSAEDRIKMILQHGADGKPKVDKDGDPIYTTGVQFWLDMALTIGYKPDITGLTQKTKVSTVAKKK